MGFIAYNKEKKDLAIIIRGTILDREWVQNVNGLGAAWNDTDLTGEFWKRKLGSEQYSLALFETFEPDPSLFLRLNGLIGLGVFLYGLYQFATGSGLDFSEFTGIKEALSAIAAYIQKDAFEVVKQIVVSGLLGVFTNVALWFLFSNPVLSLLASSKKKEKVFQSGFLELYTTPPTRPEQSSLQADVYDAIRETLAARKEIKSITVSGHSLGASLTILAAHHAALTAKSLSKTPIPVNAITFACPKAGSPEVFKSFKELGITHYHYLNRGDIVPIVMTGIFTNGLGIDNNHVLRMDPVEVDVFDQEKLSKVFLLFSNLLVYDLSSHFYRLAGQR